MTPDYSCLLGFGAILLFAIGQWVQGAELPKKEMQVAYEWRCVDYVWPSEKAREEAIRNKSYIPKSVIPFDVNVYRKRTFITTPRFQPGTPATISTISDKKRDGQYLLKPFPDWETNREGNCNGLTSVYRMTIDDHGRLWALDAGAVGLRPDYICTPQIVVFDLNAGDKIIARYPIPKTMLDPNSLLFQFKIDVRNGDYDNAFVYIADLYAFHIVVLNLHDKKFHRITHNTLLPDRREGDYYIQGTRFLITDGISTIALGPVCNNDRRVYYHAFASREECWVMASTLRDKAFATNERASQDSFYCYGKTRPAQGIPEELTDDGIMLFAQDPLNAIGCWNTKTDYNMEQNTAIVVRNDTTMQAIRGLTLIGRELYAVSTRIQLYFRGLLSPNEINFRVLRANVDNLVRNTPCDKPGLRNKS